MNVEARVANSTSRLLDDTRDAIRKSHIDQTVRLASTAPPVEGADKEEVRLTLAARVSPLRLAAVEQWPPCRSSIPV